MPYTINSSDLDDSDLGKGAFDTLLLDLQSKITILDTNIQKIRKIVNETSISAERLFCGSAKLYEEQMKENLANNRPPSQKFFLDSAPTEHAKDEFVNCQSKNAKTPKYVLTSSYKAFSQKVFVNGFSTVVIGGNQAIHLIELRKKELQKFTKKIEKKRNSFK
ncbi:MAG: hypothetical protein M9962_01815 [Oligoflexia bacterium]|nr:hypothetical protein [Oligoflexia bacterium]